MTDAAMPAPAKAVEKSRIDEIPPLREMLMYQVTQQLLQGKFCHLNFKFDERSSNQIAEIMFDQFLAEKHDSRYRQRKPKVVIDIARKLNFKKATVDKAISIFSGTNTILKTQKALERLTITKDRRYNYSSDEYRGLDDFFKLFFCETSIQTLKHFQIVYDPNPNDKKEDWSQKIAKQFPNLESVHIISWPPAQKFNCDNYNTLKSLALNIPRENMMEPIQLENFSMLTNLESLHFHNAEITKYSIWRDMFQMEHLVVLDISRKCWCHTNSRIVEALITALEHFMKTKKTKPLPELKVLDVSFREIDDQKCRKILELLPGLEVVQAIGTPLELVQNLPDMVRRCSNYESTVQSFKELNLNEDRGKITAILLALLKYLRKENCQEVRKVVKLCLDVEEKGNSFGVIMELVLNSQMLLPMNRAELKALLPRLYKALDVRNRIVPLTIRKDQLQFWDLFDNITASEESVRDLDFLDWTRVFLLFNEAARRVEIGNPENELVLTRVLNTIHQFHPEVFFEEQDTLIMLNKNPSHPIGYAAAHASKRVLRINGCVMRDGAILQDFLKMYLGVEPRNDMFFNERIDEVFSLYKHLALSNVEQLCIKEDCLKEFANRIKRWDTPVRYYQASCLVIIYLYLRSDLQNRQIYSRTKIEKFLKDGPVFTREVFFKMDQDNDMQWMEVVMKDGKSDVVKGFVKKLMTAFGRQDEFIAKHERQMRLRNQRNARPNSRPNARTNANREDIQRELDSLYEEMNRESPERDPWQQ